MKKYILIFFAAITYTIAIAKTSTNSNISTCLKKANGVTSEISNCITADTNIQDMRLNKAYRNLMNQEKSIPRKKKIQEAQRLWIKFRDANCNSYADTEGGTLEDLAVRECYRKSTEQRAKELESIK